MPCTCNPHSLSRKLELQLIQLSFVLLPGEVLVFVARLLSYSLRVEGDLKVAIQPLSLSGERVGGVVLHPVVEKLAPPSAGKSIHHPHRPSFQPVLHRSSHREQSNVGFPSLRFTWLCASHSHPPNSSRLWALTGTFFVNAWKSSAHTQQG